MYTLEWVSNAMLYFSIRDTLQSCNHPPGPAVQQVYPDSYHILSETVYEDTYCSPDHELNSPWPVICKRVLDHVNLPKLTDNDIGPENELPCPATDVAYILSSTTSGEWIKFIFPGPVPLTHVTLYYYCTGTPPQLQLSEDLMATPPKTALCGDHIRRQCLSFKSVTNETSNVVLRVKRNGDQFYLTEVEFVLDDGKCSR